MLRPFFSVIIPTLNEEHYLPRLLADLEKQTFSDFEVIVSDGKSDDRTITIVKQLRKKDPRFSLVEGPRSNVATQRNAGAHHASSSHFVFFDADVRVGPQFLQTLANRLQQKKIESCTTASISSSRKKKFILFCLLADTIYRLCIFLGQPYCWGAMMYVHRSVFEKIRGFDQTMSFMEDSELAQRIVKNGFSFRFLTSPKFVFSMRRYEKKGLLSYFRQMSTHYIAIFLHQTPVPKDAYPMDGGAK